MFFNYFLFQGLSVPLSVIFVVLFAVLVWTYLRRSNRAKNWGTYIIHSDQLSWEEKPLGRGSFGVVYKGRYRDTVVAIKRIINQDQSSEVVKAFKDEVKILVALRHPNIVLFMGACFEHDNLAIVTEFMVKGNLHSVLHDPRIVLDWSIRMQMLFDICCGMGTEENTFFSFSNALDYFLSFQPIYMQQHHPSSTATSRAPTSSLTPSSASRCLTLV